MQSLVGQPSTELVARWGPPHQRMPDGHGGEIWTYFEQREWTTPGEATTTSYGTTNASGNPFGNPSSASYSGSSSSQSTTVTVYTPAQTHSYTVHRTFFLNSDGIIYRWAWKGL